MSEKRSRLDPGTRKENILQAAIQAASSEGFYKVTREDIAEKAGVSTGLVSAYWGTMPQIRRAIMRKAVRDKVLPIIAQGLANGDSQAHRAPDEVKHAALDTLFF